MARLKSQDGSNSSRAGVYSPKSLPEKKWQETRSKPGGVLLHVAPGLSPASARSYLEQCSCHVEDDEDEGESGVPALHTADGIEEHQVSWDHEEEEDPGRA